MLFGSVSAVSRADLYVIILIAVLVFITIFYFTKSCFCYPLMRNMQKQ